MPSSFKDKATRAQELLDMLEATGREKKEHQNAAISLYNVIQNHAFFI